VPPRLNAFIHVAEDVRGSGLRIAVKDNIDVRGMPTTAGGRHLAARPAARDAACVARLRTAGCVFVGKTNLYEYAMGGWSRNPLFGDVRNPHDVRRDAGGSSGGSAAAVAAGLCDAALGTDTMGSVRIPAAFCGVVGYKPRRSAIPRSGVFPNSATLDAVGVLASDVATAAHVVDLMRRTPVARATLRRPTLAVPDDWLAGVDPVVRRAFERVTRGLPDIAFPSQAAFGAAIFPVVQYESMAVHRRWLRTAPDLYGDEVRRLLLGNARVTAAAYRAALRACRRLGRVARAALRRVDAILMPTVPCVAPIRGHASLVAQRGLSHWTLAFNVTDSAVFSIPIATRGLPIGLQIVANEEATAIAVASWAERRLRRGQRLA
jgi:Asp-tRNA(Asn)/Glu-tRNA(Gln) amidotransferase A subunit family amidase